MSLGTILVIILMLILIGVIPTWGHSRAWGYGPSGIVGVILIVLLILLLMERIWRTVSLSRLKAWLMGRFIGQQEPSIHVAVRVQQS
jgi:Na+/melibiose symporter-like transporter